MNIKDNQKNNNKKKKKSTEILTKSSSNIENHDQSSTYEAVNINLINKIENLLNIIKKTILSAKKYKQINIISVKDYNSCIQSLESGFLSLNDMLFPIKNNQTYDQEQYILKLQEITAEISVLFRLYGTEEVSDMLNVCFGADYVKNYIKNDEMKCKFDIINKYVHPIRYKVLKWKDEKTENSKKKPLQKNRIIEDFMIMESANNLECFDLARTSSDFFSKVYGIKFCVHNKFAKKTLLISGISDDIMPCCLNYKYIESKLHKLKLNKPDSKQFTGEIFERYVNSLTLKEILVYDNTKLYDKFAGYCTYVSLMKKKPINEITKDFIGSELYTQRTTMIQLLLMKNNIEYKYLAYLLYDLLSNDIDGEIDSTDQTMLFDSLPLNIKKYLHDSINQTKSYTNTLLNYDSTKIPLEQRICLLKANNSVKEKAMTKLKEVKAKSEDSGIKAKQYLEGLLKIPFGMYKEEQALNIMKTMQENFKNYVEKINNSGYEITQFLPENKYSNTDVKKYEHILCTTYKAELFEKLKASTFHSLTTCKRSELINNTLFINSLIKKYYLEYDKLLHSGKKRSYMIENIKLFIEFLFSNQDKYFVIEEIAYHKQLLDKSNNPFLLLQNISDELDHSHQSLKKYMSNVTDILNESVHGHDKVKRQIERIIGQWITGEQTGYCFGFEGPPGVGKTSLAKHGIANCLKDEEGNPRPFSFIAIGGSSNGSTIDGHNYTYVGSTWGKIVDILMDKQCMNPIIFIDELDKISRTENGKEIIGILTHLIDSTQNDTFQDKYFSGIDIDVSKALFIFSYNDASVIDSILLDRIHRIKFDHLSIENKLVIVNKYILPEIYKNMGIEKAIRFPDDVIIHIIEKYTCEPGVRKLKQILFEIIGEINLTMIQNYNNSDTLPLILNKKTIDKKYLKDRKEYKPAKVHTTNSIGLITGLWANAVGQGGILPIEVSFYPCDSFLNLKLTGMQGDVMKESMTVAKTLAWSLINKTTMNSLQKNMVKTKYQGIHIHVPEGATPKDGPSAGTAITTAIYSLLSGKNTL